MVGSVALRPPYQPRSATCDTTVSFINERGEIAGGSTLPTGETRAILLIPCDRDHANFEGCEGHVDEIVTDNTLVTTTAVPNPSSKPSVNHEGRRWKGLRFSSRP